MRVPGGFGCNYANEDDPRAPSAVLNTSPSDVGNGGFDAAKIGITSVIAGEGEDLDGVGDEAFFVVGSSLGGSSFQGGGLVLLGGTIVQLTLLQANDLPDDEVRTLVVDALTLVGSRG